MMQTDENSIVIVDDDRDMADLVHDFAETLGYNPVIATSGRQCLVEVGKTKPACIIMDIVMPDMDGVELLNQLADASCDTPVIVMSGYDGKYLASVAMIAEAKGVQILGTLRKPFTMDQLKNRLAVIGNRANACRSMNS